MIVIICIGIPVITLVLIGILVKCTYKIETKNSFWDVAYGGVFKKKDPNQTIT